MSDTVTAAVAPPHLGSPIARRLDQRRWKDPRLWVGIALVAASVLAGARLLSGADDTVGVWTTSRDLAAGAPLDGDALVVEQVHGDGDLVDRYLLAGEPPPAGAVAAHALGAGEILPRTAVTERGAGAGLHLPVVVSAAGAPDDLGAGDVVDVWVVPPKDSSGAVDPATMVLDDVRVVSASRDSGPLGESATRQVLLGLPKADTDLGELLSSVAGGSVVLLRAGS
ncbi:MAG: hypothetical protein ACRDO1_13840 [Nocardioidaceae bacterium]